MAKMILQLAAPSHRPSPRLRADEVNEQHRKFSTLEREVYEHKRARIDASLTPDTKQTINDLLKEVSLKIP